MSKPKSHYKKQRNIGKSTLATIRIVLTVTLIASMVMLGYCIIHDGWDAVIKWFGSSWACMFALILLFGAVAVLWIVALYKKIKAVSDDEK